MVAVVVNLGVDLDPLDSVKLADRDMVVHRCVSMHSMQRVRVKKRCMCVCV